MKEKFRYGRIAGIPFRIWVKTENFRRRIWQYIDNPTDDSAPVFLVGCGRSGTNMVIDKLATSWQVDAYNEDHPAAFEEWRLREFNIIGDLINQSHARIILFKPILDTHLASTLLSRFDKSKILYSCRHYDDVVNSAMKLFGEKNWPLRVKAWIENDFSEFASSPPPEETKTAIRLLWNESLTPESAIALYWMFYNLLFFDLGLYNDTRVRLVIYDNAVNHPLQEFEQICGFLGIKFRSSMIQNIYSTSIKRDPSPVIAKNIRMECETLWRRLTMVPRSIMLDNYV